MKAKLNRTVESRKTKPQALGTKFLTLYLSRPSLYTFLFIGFTSLVYVFATLEILTPSLIVGWFH
jgi:hypothetical protein